MCSDSGAGGHGQGYGKMARVLLSDFSASTIDVLDFTLTDTDLIGFKGGFTDGKFGCARS